MSRYGSVELKTNFLVLGDGRFNRDQRIGSKNLPSLPIGSMYGIYANIGGILMVNVTILPYIAYMDPMGYG